MSCQKMHDTTMLSCSLHDIKVHTTLVDDIKSQKIKADYVREDIWTKKFLQQDTFNIQFDKNGVNDVLIGNNVNQAIWGIIGAFTNLLDVGLNLNEKIEGDYIKKANLTNGYCKTKFFITRSIENENNDDVKLNNFNLFLINKPNETLTRIIEIARKIEDDNCSFKRYSAFLHREIRKLKPQDFHVDIISAGNFMTISDKNLTSFSKTHMKVTNFKKNIKYMIDESMSMSLKNIKAIKLCENNEKISTTKN
ncbi:uncharacterized protein LOC122851774 isoform X2 [Aphidius gifuensis]|nr:uncharacterized protein LOC122851774 isoform X2 [Aphidius gifuensis]